MLLGNQQLIIWILASNIMPLSEAWFAKIWCHVGLLGHGEWHKKVKGLGDFQVALRAMWDWT